MPVEKEKKGVNFVTLRRHGRLQPERRRRCVCVRACVRACGRVRACSRVRACKRVRVCMRERACVRACVSACVMCLPYTIMIFHPGLYFIQIRHTDDFPSTATRLVQDNNTYRCIYMLETAVVYGPLLTFYVSEYIGIPTIVQRTTLVYSTILSSAYIMQFACIQGLDNCMSTGSV